MHIVTKAAPDGLADRQMCLTVEKRPERELG